MTLRSVTYLCLLACLLFAAPLHKLTFSLPPLSLQASNLQAFQQWLEKPYPGATDLAALPGLAGPGALAQHRYSSLGNLHQPSSSSSSFLDAIQQQQQLELVEAAAVAPSSRKNRLDALGSVYSSETGTGGALAPPNVTSSNTAASLMAGAQQHHQNMIASNTASGSSPGPMPLASGLDTSSSHTAKEQDIVHAASKEQQVMWSSNSSSSVADTSNLLSLLLEQDMLPSGAAIDNSPNSFSGFDSPPAETFARSSPLSSSMGSAASTITPLHTPPQSFSDAHLVPSLEPSYHHMSVAPSDAALPQCLEEPLPAGQQEEQPLAVTLKRELGGEEGEGGGRREEVGVLGGRWMELEADEWSQELQDMFGLLPPQLPMDPVLYPPQAKKLHTSEKLTDDTRAPSPFSPSPSSHWSPSPSSRAPSPHPPLSHKTSSSSSSSLPSSPLSLSTSGYKGQAMMFGHHEDKVIAKLLSIMHQHQHSSSSSSKKGKMADRRKLVTMAVEDFNMLLERAHLSEIEVAFMKEWRRRGKNKTAAQVARKRKREELGVLDTEVQGLRSQHGQLQRKIESLTSSLASLKSRAMEEEEQVYRQYSLRHSTPVSRQTHSIHVVSGQLMLVPRDTSRVLLARS